MTGYRDDTQMNVPDVFRPELAPDQQPVVKKYNRWFGYAVLGVALFAGMLAVVWWQDTSARVALRATHEEHEMTLLKEQAKADLLGARYEALQTSIAALEKQARKMDGLISQTPRYPGVVTPRQQAAIDAGKDPKDWIDAREAELRAARACLFAENTAAACE
jgi:hypothetical protein